MQKVKPWPFATCLSSVVRSSGPIFLNAFGRPQELLFDDLDQFREFGELRNSIQHFAAPDDEELQSVTARFIFGVLDPIMVWAFGLYAVDYDEVDVPYETFIPVLFHREILFRVSPLSAREDVDWNVDWSSVSTEYSTTMWERLTEARGVEETDHPAG